MLPYEAPRDLAPLLSFHPPQPHPRLIPSWRFPAGLFLGPRLHFHSEASGNAHSSLPAFVTSPFLSLVASGHNRSRWLVVNFLHSFSHQHKCGVSMAVVVTLSRGLTRGSPQVSLGILGTEQGLDVPTSPHLKAFLPSFLFRAVVCHVGSPLILLFSSSGWYFTSCLLECVSQLSFFVVVRAPSMSSVFLFKL